MWLGSSVAVAQVGSYSSDVTPSLGTSKCQGRSPKKKTKVSGPRAWQEWFRWTNGGRADWRRCRGGAGKERGESLRREAGALFGGGAKSESTSKAQLSPWLQEEKASGQVSETQRRGTEMVR